MDADDLFFRCVMIFLALAFVWIAVAVVRALFGMLAPVFFGIIWAIVSVMLGIITVGFIIYCVVVGLILVLRGME